MTRSNYHRADGRASATSRLGYVLRHGRLYRLGTLLVWVRRGDLVAA
jgi:hypothetical protein